MQIIVLLFVLFYEKEKKSGRLSSSFCLVDPMSTARTGFESSFKGMSTKHFSEIALFGKFKYHIRISNFLTLKGYH
jgi:hypothetical protein